MCITAHSFIVVVCTSIQLNDFHVLHSDITFNIKITQLNINVTPLIIILFNISVTLLPIMFF